MRQYPVPPPTSRWSPAVADRARHAPQPGPMDYHEKMRIRAAAFRATRLYPGAVGELISRELLSWEEFGYRLGRDRLVMTLVADVLKACP